MPRLGVWATGNCSNFTGAITTLFTVSTEMGKRPRPYNLKAATARLVRATGGQVRAARLIGISPSRLQELLDPEKPRYLDAAQVLTLEQHCGEMIVTGFLAHEQGAVLMRLLQGADSRTNLLMARIGGAVAHLFGSYEAAIDHDGTISAEATGRLTKDIDDALSRIAELRAALRAN